jgi:hypothetical protein
MSTPEQEWSNNPDVLNIIENVAGVPVPVKAEPVSVSAEPAIKAEATTPENVKPAPTTDSSIDTESAVYKAFKTLGAYQAPRNIPEKYKREADLSPRIAYLMGEYGLSKDEAARFVFIQRYFEDFISNEKSDHLGIHGVGFHEDSPNPIHGKVSFKC